MKHVAAIEAACPGTNLKVGGGGGERHARNRAPENFLSCPSAFFGCTSRISRFGERFRDGQYSLASFLFAVLHTVHASRAKPFAAVGGGGGVPGALCSRRHRLRSSQKTRSFMFIIIFQRRFTRLRLKQHRDED